MSQPKAHVLVVDDDMLNRTLLSANLEEAGYQVSCAENGRQALAGLRATEFDVVLLDLVMPDMDGFEVLEHIKGDAKLCHLPVIVVSSVEEMESVVRCIEMGAADHLSKPFNPPLLHARIEAALAAKRLHDQQESYREDLERQVWEQTQDLQRSHRRLEGVLDGVVLALSSVVDLRDPYTSGHQQRVTNLACAIAAEMGLPDEQVKGIQVAGLLHDIGKICVPAEILSKPGRIADIEFSIIKVHPQVGHEILRNIDFTWPIADIVAQHHEALDGSGYPEGLSGDDILLESRILTVADVVEAMASHRPYRPSLGIEVAMEAITSQRGVRFDERVVEACAAICQREDLPFDERTADSVDPHGLPASVSTSAA